MRIFLLSILLLMTRLAYTQNIISVYLFPGQGSDERIFSKIQIGSNFKPVHVTYPIPKKGETLAQYARTISYQIDTTTKYLFIGVSIGGMICTELADFLNPEKIIIISSAKCRQELPLRYRFQKYFCLCRIVPKGLIKLGAQILQPIVEPDRKKHKEVFKSMLKSKSPEYYKRTVSMIINWDRATYNDSIVHIHGTKDHTLPIRKVKAGTVIEKGSHMMTLTRGDEINNLIQSMLNLNQEK